MIAVLAYLVALGPAGATASDAIAATAVGEVFGSWAGKLVALTILVSTFSATNSVILTAPRVFYAMAQDDLFFKSLRSVHERFHTPGLRYRGSRRVVGSTDVCWKILGVDWRRDFCGMDFYGLGAAAIFPIRRAAAGRPIPYRVPGYPWTPLIFVLAAAAIVGNAIYPRLPRPFSVQESRRGHPSVPHRPSRLLLLAKTRCRLNSVQLDPGL